MTTYGRHRRIAATVVAALFVAPIALAALFPVVDLALSTLLIGAVAVAVAGYWLREAYREAHHRRLMQAIERDPRYAIGPRSTVVPLTKREATR